MSKNDFRCIGFSYAEPFRVAASATRGYAGEPMLVIPTYTSGVSNVNTIVVATDATPVIGTDQFVGILNKDMEVNSAGTVTAQRTTCQVPVANSTRIRAQVKDTTTADTETEAIGLLFDIYKFDLTTAKYTWDPAAADTAGFTARWYNVSLSELDCVADARILSRADIT